MLKDKQRRGARIALFRGLFTAALALAAPALAQDRPVSSASPSERKDEIVVVGSPDRDEQVRDFVRGMTPTMEESLARWDATDACPVTIGLTPADNQAITDRLRRVAVAAKVPLAPADCKRANTLVIFTTDAKAVVLELLKRAPGWFHDVHGDPIAMPKAEGPVVAWHVDGQIDRWGQEQHMQPGSRVNVHKSSGLASRITTAARPIYKYSIVVIERMGAVGLTRTQLADYAAMRAFSGAKPVEAAKLGTPSILTVMEAPMGSETPQSLTKWDLAFLKGLYDAPATLHVGAQRGAIVESMKRGLGNDPPK